MLLNVFWGYFELSETNINYVQPALSLLTSKVVVFFFKLENV